MLYMATHTDTRAASRLAERERQAAFRQVLSNAGKNGVVIHGMYMNQQGYTVFFLFEADSPDQIESVFDPLLAFGAIESVPVTSQLDI